MTRPNVLIMVFTCVACATHTSYQAAGPSASSASECIHHPSSDTTIYNADTVFRKPVFLHGPEIKTRTGLFLHGLALETPTGLRQPSISGHRVVYSFVVNADGRPDPNSLRLVSSDASQFESVAYDYVQRSMFSPGCLGERAVRVRVVMPIDFRSKR